MRQCGICLGNDHSTANQLAIGFPGKKDDVAHEKCFEKIKAVWQLLYEDIQKHVKHSHRENDVHKKVILHIYKEQLPTLGKKTILEVVEDPNMGLSVLSKIFQTAFTAILSKD